MEVAPLAAVARPPSIASEPQPATLILQGKRSRRKVNKPIDYSVEQVTGTTPRIRSRKSSGHSNGNYDLGGHHDDHEPMQIDSVAGKRKRSTPKKSAAFNGNHGAMSAEIAEKRERLLQRKAELESYLKRLQIALSVEQSRGNAPVANGSLVDGDHTSFAAVDSTPVSSSRRKPVPSAKKKRPESSSSHTRPSPMAAAVLPFVDSDIMDTSVERASLRIVDDLLRNQYGDVFATPVDWRLLNLPTYPDIVRNPMDLGTVRSRLINQHYRNSLSSFVSDMQLIWDNAKLFNAPKTFVHEATLAMERIWSRKIHNLQRERRRSSMVNSDSLSQQGSPVATTPVAFSAPLPMSSSNEVRPLTFMEKSKLRGDIVKVPTSQVERIVAIVRSSEAASRPASFTQQESSVELDIDKLSTQTLRQLQKFVASVLQRSSSASSRAAHARHSSASIQQRTLSTSQSNVSAIGNSESDSDSSSSSGLDSESSDEEAMLPPPASSSTNLRFMVTSSVSPPVSQATPVEEPHVELANPDAWSNLAAEGHGADPVQPAANISPATEEANVIAPLWQDFQTKSAEAIERERVREAEEVQRREDQERIAREQQALQESLRAEKEADDVRRVQELADREEERQRQLEAEREAARRALEQDEDEIDDQAGAIDDFQNLMSA